MLSDDYLSHYVHITNLMYNSTSMTLTEAIDLVFTRHCPVCQDEDTTSCSYCNDENATNITTLSTITGHTPSPEELI